MSTSEPAQKSEWRFLTLTGGEWLKMIVPLILGTLIGSLLTWINWTYPKLTYTVQNPVFFEGEKNSFGLLTVSVQNDGSKVAEDVFCSIPISKDKVQEVKVTPEFLQAKVEIEDSNIRVSLPHITPPDSFQVSVLSTSPEVLPKDGIITVRGKGVIGSRPSSSEAFSFLSLIAFLPPTIAGACLGWVLAEGRYEKRLTVSQASFAKFLNEQANRQFYDAKAEEENEKSDSSSPK